jgi:hypothetical protein
MRRTVLSVLAASLIALGCGTGWAAQGVSNASADLTVQDDIVCSSVWQSTSTNSKDFGGVLPNSSANDVLELTVNHNMGASQTFSLGVNVQKLAGPDWDSDVVANDGAENLTWAQADFGTNQVFAAAIGGTTEDFTEPLAITFNVAAGQDPSAYQFQITLTVTSL